MKVLWTLEEASVREIREGLAADSRPLAYTTVETIMDRLARKGVVTRHKAGRAHRYKPLYEKAAARAQAVRTLVEHFFEGSRQALLAHLAGTQPVTTPRSVGSLAAAVKRGREGTGPSGRRQASSSATRVRSAGDVKPEVPIDTSLL